MRVTEFTVHVPCRPITTRRQTPHRSMGIRPSRSGAYFAMSRALLCLASAMRSQPVPVQLEMEKAFSL
jgi:hypothetical protein